MQTRGRGSKIPKEITPHLRTHFGPLSGNTDRHGIEGVDEGEAAGALRLRRDVADVRIDPQEETYLPARAVLQRLREEKLLYKARLNRCPQVARISLLDLTATFWQSRNCTTGLG